MKRSSYGRTDLTKSIIRKTERILEKMKTQNPCMTWKERNIIMSEISNNYKDEFMFQPIMFGDSICKWWNKKYR